MLAAVPLFGWIASRFPRRLVLPGVYLFFALNLVGFWVLLKSAGAGATAAGAFFIWASVFNLFVISLFWSLMAELWSNDEAKRLYGFISAGGTAGALAGPVLTQVLVSYLAPADLLLVSAGLADCGAVASLVLRRVHPGGGHETEPAGGGIFDGAAKVFASPYLGADRALCISRQHRRHVFLHGTIAACRRGDPRQRRAGEVFRKPRFDRGRGHADHSDFRHGAGDAAPRRDGGAHRFAADGDGWHVGAGL